MKQQLLSIPLKGSILRECELEMGVRLRLRLLHSKPNTDLDWTPAEYELQFYRVREGSVDLFFPKDPQTVTDYAVEEIPIAESNRQEEKLPFYRVSITFEKGITIFEAQGVNFSPLQSLVRVG